MREVVVVVIARFAKGLFSHTERFSISVASHAQIASELLSKNLLNFIKKLPDVGRSNDDNLMRIPRESEQNFIWQRPQNNLNLRFVFWI